VPRPLKENEIRTAGSIFRDYLRGRGLKYTHERQILLEEVLSNPEHFEAEQLLVSLRQAGKRVAKATIYRTLPLLVDCGIINQVQFGDSLSRYEHTFGQEPHDHMVCLRCRRVIEFDSGEILHLRMELARRYNFQPLSHRFQIAGICAQCTEGRPAEEPPSGPDGKASVSRGRRKSKPSR
jgi:Fur family ferric uptake transcriptional regulator